MLSQGHHVASQLVPFHHRVAPVAEVTVGRPLRAVAGLQDRKGVGRQVSVKLGISGIWFSVLSAMLLKI